MYIFNNRNKNIELWTWKTTIYAYTMDEEILTIPDCMRNVSSLRTMKPIISADMWLSNDFHLGESPGMAENKVVALI